MTEHSYYVVMRDLGRLGREAVVDPNMSRSEVIDRIRSGEWSADQIIFIHWIESRFVDDVTEEMVEAAGIEQGNDRILSGEDLRLTQFDHAHDLRKHGEVA